jgi:hypothetical protein
MNPKHIRQRRRRAARRQGARLLDQVRAVVPSNLPEDLREDVIQELALAALRGQVEPLAMSTAVPQALRRVRSLMAKPFNHVYLDHPLPGTDLRPDVAG